MPRSFTVQTLPTRCLSAEKKRAVEISTDAMKYIQMPLAQVTATAVNVTLQTKM